MLYIYKYIMLNGDKKAIVYATCEKIAQEQAVQKFGRGKWITKMRVRLNKEMLECAHKRGDKAHLIGIKL